MDIEHNGIEIFRKFIPQKTVDTIINEISSIDLSSSMHGIRNAEKKISSILDLANSDIVQTKVASILGSSAQLVRAIFFDKTPDKNWLVTWHQDKTIAVNEKVDLAH